MYIAIYCRQAAEPGKSHARSSRGLCRLGTFRLSLWWCKSGFLLQTSPRRPARAVSRKSEQPWGDPRHTAAQISRRRPPGANEPEHRAPARPPKLEGGDKAGATQLSELSPCNSPHATPVVPRLEPAARKTDKEGGEPRINCWLFGVDPGSGKRGVVVQHCRVTVREPRAATIFAATPLASSEDSQR